MEVPAERRRVEVTIRQTATGFVYAKIVLLAFLLNESVMGLF